jgi:hypothetical protein
MRPVRNKGLVVLETFFVDSLNINLGLVVYVLDLSDTEPIQESNCHK